MSIMVTTNTAQPSERLSRLLGFLKRDPSNAALLSDAAEAAFEAGDFREASQLLDRYETHEPLSSPLTNLRGLVALAERRFEAAADIFAALRAADGDDPALRFNLAFAKSNLGEYENALALLDDDTVAAAPRAPSLKIHVLHHLGRYDEALDAGEVLAQRFPENEALMGALATLSLDAEKADLARHYGQKAGDNAEGRAALGFLALGDQHVEQSLELFDEALAVQPGNPRAWMGKGLGLLAIGDSAKAVEAIDHGAQLFNGHVGSWIASGWAHFVNGEMDEARASFDRAMAIDANFSESHGGLAVLDILEGRLEQAKRESEIALRLDRNSLGGALSASLLLERAGKPELAQRIRERAMTMPIGPNGLTIAQALAGFGSRLQR